MTTVDRGGGARGAADPGFLLRALRVLGLAVAVALGALLLVYATEVFLLAFAGVLVAVLLRAPSDWLSRRTGLPSVWALVLVVLAIVAALAGVGWLTVPSLISQAGQFADQVPQVIRTVEEWIEGLGGQRLDLHLREVLPSAQAMLGRIPGAVTTAFGALASALIILVVGVYMAAYPGVYVSGLVRLFPIERRGKVRAVLDEVGHVLRRFLVGQLVSMAAVGVLSYVGLLILGVPLALGLAVLTALLEFVPYIGPILAAVPVILIGLTESPTTALYAFLLYLGVQLVESNVIAPLVQARAVYLPPALTILVQTLMGVLFGLLGIFLATPLAAAALVLVRRLYIRDVLGDTGGGRGG